MTLRVLVASGCGINSQEELAEAWALAGAWPRIVHVNDLFGDVDLLAGADVFCLPGGFSFGDDLGSGKVLANRLRFRRCADGVRFFDRLRAFLDRGGFVLGICNGFQVLVRLGLLPNVRGRFEQEVTLAPNDSGRFEDRWVRLAPDPAALLRHSWLAGEGSPAGDGRLDGCLDLPVRHGEGKLLIGDEKIRRAVLERGLVPWRYADAEGRPTAVWPHNPNGSELQAAGLFDVTGRVLGMMPHPEAFLHATLHPDWAGRRWRSASAGPIAPPVRVSHPGGSAQVGGPGRMGEPRETGDFGETGDGLALFRRLVMQLEPSADSHLPVGRSPGEGVPSSPFARTAAPRTGLAGAAE